MSVGGEEVMRTRSCSSGARVRARHIWSAVYRARDRAVRPRDRNGG